MARQEVNPIFTLEGLLTRTADNTLSLIVEKDEENQQSLLKVGLDVLPPPAQQTRLFSRYRFPLQLAQSEYDAVEYLKERIVHVKTLLGDQSDIDVGLHVDIKAWQAAIILQLGFFAYKGNLNSFPLLDDNDVVQYVSEYPFEMVIASLLPQRDLLQYRKPGEQVYMKNAEHQDMVKRNLPAWLPVFDEIRLVYPDMYTLKGIIHLSSGLDVAPQSLVPFLNLPDSWVDEILDGIEDIL